MGAATFFITGLEGSGHHMVADLLLQVMPNVHPFPNDFNKTPRFDKNDKWNYVIHRSIPYGAVGRKRFLIDPDAWVKAIEESGRTCKVVVLSRDIEVLRRSTTKRHTKKLERTKKDQAQGRKILSQMLDNDEYDMYLFNYEAAHCLGREAYLQRFIRWAGRDDWDGNFKIRNENLKYFS